MLTPRTDDDGGFTLIEMLITIVILGIISLALGDALIGFSQNTDSTLQRLSESHDAQISATYFGQDVASMGLRSPKPPYAFLQSVDTDATSKTLPCGDTGTPVVRLGWDDPTSVAQDTQVTVAYVVETVGSERQLHRLVCNGTSGTPVADTVMAHNLDSTLPVVTCAADSGAKRTKSGAMSCNGSAAAVPDFVTMVLSINGDNGSPYTVTLSGQRRQTS